MSVSTTVTLNVTTDETFSAGVTAVTDPTVRHDGFNVTVKYDADTDTDATACVYMTQALTAGAATIDLTSLTGTGGASVSLSGKKPRALLFNNPSDNDILVAKGASSGYAPTGTTFSVTVPPGGTVALDLADGATAVAGGAKTWDLTGTGTDTLNVGIVVGT